MRIPKENHEREQFFCELISKCLSSRATRRTDYAILRSWFLFACGPDEAPAQYNKIQSHIDQLTSFIYSADTTRFSIPLGASVDPEEENKVPVLTKAINDEWLNSNGDQVFSSAVNWALVFNSTFIKLVVDKNGGIHPYMVEPSNINVLREDLPFTDRQEAIVQSYYITKSELYSRLYSHPKRESIIKKLQAVQHQPNETPSGIDRVITSAINPTMIGNVNLDLNGYNRMIANVAEETIEMQELWVWDDEENEYNVLTVADPDIIIYDRKGSEIFLKGELPFIQVCPNPQYDYYWGQSEVSKLVLLQEMYNNRITEILTLLKLQVNPPVVLSGFMGIPDEKQFAMDREGSMLYSDTPGAKADRLAPTMPQDIFAELNRLDDMFAEVSGISNILAGRGESGVRSSGHASQLARLGSSRPKKRALIIEDSLEKVATLYLKLMQEYDKTHYTAENGMKFTAKQFTSDFTVKVDAHSNSPIFMEDSRALAFNLFKVGVIGKEDLINLVDPPRKQLLLSNLKKLPQQPPPSHGKKPDLKLAGESGS